MVILGDYIKLVGGGTPSKAIEEYWNGDIPWASVKDFKTEYLTSTQDYISQKGVENSSTRVIPKGTMLIATRMAVGKVVIPLIDVAINQDLKAIFCDSSLHQKFLFYILKSKADYFDSISSGATVKGIKINQITDLQIPLPPLVQQKKIAAILDAADAYRQKTKVLIAKYDELTQSLFLDMFGDPVKNEKGFRTILGNEIFVFSSGKFNPTKNLSPFFEYATYGGNGVTGYSKDYMIDFQTIIIGRVGAYCGSVHLSTGKIWVTDNAIYIKEIKKALNLTYAYYFFEKYNLNRFADYSGQPKITQKPLESLKFVYPEISLQNQFAVRVQAIEEQKAQAQSSLEKAEELFNSLLQRAFKGELV